VRLPPVRFPLPVRPIDAARRIATGIGLDHVVRLERAVDAVAEAVAENLVLEAGLRERVAALERSLIEPLEARHRWRAEHDAHEPDDDAGPDARA
jgi:hypothetical protein